ncbi:MAG: hypothetical protein JXB60_04505 [Candidatus Cloacimonetes bacterium]|nr:hypothetical protein [Candidatus Cloacimonadota bacterium]
MVTLRRSTKIMIILVVFLISVYAGIKKSSILDIFSTPNKVVEDSHANTIYKNAQNYKKAQLLYKSVQMGETVNKVISALQDSRNHLIYSNSTEELYVALFEAPDSLFQQNSNELRKISGLVNENIHTNDKVRFDINIEAHLENKETTKNKILELINKSSIPERVSQFTVQLEKVQAEIDSLSNQDKMLRKFQDNYLMYVRIRLDESSNEGLLLHVREFILTTLIVFVMLILALTIFYLCVILLLKVMSSLGIRTSHGSSSSYRYYSDRPYKRKIKRIYKPMPDEDKEEKES